MTGSVLAQNVKVEYDKGNDFSGYKTYTYVNGTPANADKIPVGHLIIHICDVKNRKYIWRGTASSTLSDSPEKVEKTLSKALTQMFEKYPSPPAKKQ
jgi:Domain of unknown function (DUF4136)